MTVWIRTSEELAALARTLEGSRAIAVDTESDSLFHHVEKVCLVQIASEDGQCTLVDTLVLRDLTPLAPLMADASVLKVLHGADYDVTTLKRDFGFSFASIFDTMIAARLLGRPELGLAALAQRELGVTLSKGNQKDDWSRRPLTPQQETYAALDVAHLVALQRRLAAELESLGRLSWLREECDAVARLEPLTRRHDKDAYLSIKGANRLSPRALAALRELVAWRERRAEETDIPAFKILGNDVLLRMAELPADARELPALPPRIARHADQLRSALARAHALDASELPVARRAPRPVVPEAVQQRVQRLRAWRTAKAQALGVDVSVVLPQRLIDKLAEAAPREAAGLDAVEGLRRWRIETFGRELLAAL